MPLAVPLRPARSPRAPSRYSPRPRRASSRRRIIGGPDERHRLENLVAARPAAGRHGSPQLRRVAAKYLSPEPPKSISRAVEHDSGSDVPKLPQNSESAIGRPPALSPRRRRRNRLSPHRLELEAWSQTHFVPRSGVCRAHASRDRGVGTRPGGTEAPWIGLAWCMRPCAPPSGRRPKLKPTNGARQPIGAACCAKPISYGRGGG